MNTKKTYQICKCCVMDNNTDTDITFDEKGVCMRCNEYKKRILPEWNYGNGHEEELQELLKSIRSSGKNPEYDCILGLSGGSDSTYMLHLAVTEWKLRPFVFHIDAGWNLPVAERNIKRVTDKLGVKLHIKKLDREELRQMQLAWFRTGFEALDAPQDHAFISLIDYYSRRIGVKYVLNGYNIATEIVADPESWFKNAGPAGDGTYMKSVIKKHSDMPFKEIKRINDYTFTNGFRHKFLNPYIFGIKTVKPLNLVPVTRRQMIDTLRDKYGYEDYGQKHFEDLLTKFLEGYWSIERFGHDIRRAQLSSLVMTGQMDRDEALEILKRPPLTEEESQELFKEVCKRLDISEDELKEYLTMPKETGIKYRSNAKVYTLGIRLYEMLGVEKRIRR